MSGKRRPGRTLCVLIGAQAIALAALAQTPDTQRPSDRATPPSSTSDPSDANSSSREWDRGADPTRSESARTGADRTDDHASMDHSKMKPVTAQSFASQAAVINKAEIELAQVALENTKNEEIRMYAERLVKDHTAANQKLTKIASQENLKLPQSLDAEHKAVKQKLSGLQGDAFDREYKKHMTMGHDKAVALFESASQTQQMPSDLKEFAASTLPTLKRHKEMAKSLDAKEGA